MTLEQFLADPTKRNAHVRLTGFEILYVRKGQRYIDGHVLDNVLDIANVSVRERRRGQGLFTALVNRLQTEHPELTLYVESVMNPRLPRRLLSLGFRQTGSTGDCFVRTPKDVSTLGLRDSRPGD